MVMPMDLVEAYRNSLVCNPGFVGTGDYDDGDGINPSAVEVRDGVDNIRTLVMTMIPIQVTYYHDGDGDTMVHPPVCKLVDNHLASAQILVTRLAASILSCGTMRQWCDEKAMVRIQRMFHQSLNCVSWSSPT